MKYLKACFCKKAKELTKTCPDDTTAYIIAVTNEETVSHDAKGNFLDLLSLITEILKSRFQNPDRLKDVAQVLYFTLRDEAEKKELCRWARSTEQVRN